MEHTIHMKANNKAKAIYTCSRYIYCSICLFVCLLRELLQLHALWVALSCIDCWKASTLPSLSLSHSLSRSLWIRSIDKKLYAASEKNAHESSWAGLSSWAGFEEILLKIQKLSCLALASISNMNMSKYICGWCGMWKQEHQKLLMYDSLILWESWKVKRSQKLLICKKLKVQ